MYDEQGESLFGHDGRYKPPLPNFLTAEGWGSSQGRLAYSGVNRQDEQNFSEYAVKSLGFVPQGYVIVNAKDIRYNPDTSLMVGHGRVAIPVKDFARQRRLTLEEQWELMNPKWVGTYFNYLEWDTYRSKRMTLYQAIDKADKEGRLDEFMQQFWSPIFGHEKAIRRLKNRADTLKREADRLDDEAMILRRKISQVESDIHYCRYEKYHLGGFNVHQYLSDLKYKLMGIGWDLDEKRAKSERIYRYLKQISFDQQLYTITY